MASLHTFLGRPRIARHRRAILSLLSLAAYFLFSTLARPLLDDASVLFSILPILLVSWELGFLPGLASSLLVTLVEIGLHVSQGDPILNAEHLTVWLSGLLALLSASCAMAWVRRLNDRAQHALEERQKAEAGLREREALRDIAAALNGTLELEEVLDRILHQVHQVASYDAINVMLIEDDRVRVVRHKGYQERGLMDYIDGFSRRIEEVPGLHWMITHQQPLVIPDTRKDSAWLVFPPTEWILSYAGLPIHYRGKMIGFLNFNSATPDFFQPGHIDRLKPFADQAALAIMNARAFEDTRRRAQRLAMINRVAHALNQPLELKAVLQMTVDCLAEALNLSQVALALYNDTRDRLTIAADHPAPGTPSAVGIDIGLVNNQSMQYIHEKKTWLLAEDAQHDDRLITVRENLAQRGILSMLLLPILVRGEVIGTIGCDVTEPNRRLTREEIDLAETITDLAAVRIEQARLFSAERKRASALALLHVTSLDITMHNDLPNLLQTIIERAAWLMDASGGTLYLADPQKQELVCQVCHNLTHDEVGTVARYGEGAVGIVAETGKPLVVPDYGNWPKRLLDQDQIGDFAAVASVPVLWQNRVTGVIQLVRRDPQRPYTKDEINTLSLFSSQVAISIENARLYSAIQQSAIQDTLTRLYNRRGLYEAGQREVERARRFRRPLSAMIMDIDHFKTVNDTYGHLVGDQVLVGLADLCRLHMRSIDITGRYGGEEFVMILLENDLDAAGTVANRLCQLIAQTPFHTNSGNVQITVSIGVAELNSATNDLPDLIRAADEALYRAKRSGRNQVQYYTPEFNLSSRSERFLH